MSKLEANTPLLPIDLGPRTSGLAYRIGETMDEAVGAWRMVYMAYRRAGLIDSNPHRVHTAPQAVGQQAAVIAGYIGPLCVSTLTAVADSSQGLPLDRVYGAELRSLRADGRNLMEVGLFADRRKQLNRSAESLFQLMRYAFYYGLQHDVTDFVIGVHPRHARFYTRAFGFEPMGATKTYPAVNNRPVVLLRGNVQARIVLVPRHPALDFFVNNPVDVSIFDRRCRFDPAQVAASSIGAFLSDLRYHDDASASQQTA